MIIVSSQHEGFLSNSYLVGSGEGGDALIIDTGGPMEPLLGALDEHDLELHAVINTHEHQDHTMFNVEWLGRYDVPLHTVGDLQDGEVLDYGELSVRVMWTPGHVAQHVCLLVNDEAVFTGDTLMKGTVGGTVHGGADADIEMRRTICDRLLGLADSIRVYPGHAEPTTIGDERVDNPFVRFWLRGETNAAEDVHVAGRSGTLMVRARDYDGGEKALVQFADGRFAIVGGAMIERDAVNALSVS